MKHKLVLLILLQTIFSFSQGLPCEKVAKELEADSTRAIWNHLEIPVETYACIGRYFAERDHKEGIYLLHSYGHPDDENPCITCKYSTYGYDFIYHEDIIYEPLSEFIDGYNSVSYANLKAKIGDSAFAQLNDIPKDWFNPNEFISRVLNDGTFQNYLNIHIVNDTTIHVKLLVDSLFKAYPSFIPKVVYHLKDIQTNNNTTTQIQQLNYSQIQTKGFYLSRKSNKRYYLTLKVDFKALANSEKICWCDKIQLNQSYFRLPLKLE